MAALTVLVGLSAFVVPSLELRLLPTSFASLPDPDAAFTGAGDESVPEGDADDDDPVSPPDESDSAAATP